MGGLPKGYGRRYGVLDLSRNISIRHLVMKEEIKSGDTLPAGDRRRFELYFLPLQGKGHAQSQVEEVAIIIDKQARQYLDQGRYDEAEPLYKRALAIREKALGYKHLGLLTVLTKYADLLRKMSRGDEAAKLDARVAEIRAKPNPKMSN
jgi:tetratricopeptide (TPR) repeat protein